MKQATQLLFAALRELDEQYGVDNQGRINKAKALRNKQLKLGRKAYRGKLIWQQRAVTKAKA